MYLLLHPGQRWMTKGVWLGCLLLLSQSVVLAQTPLLSDLPGANRPVQAPAMVQAPDVVPPCTDAVVVDASNPGFVQQPGWADFDWTKVPPPYRYPRPGAFLIGYTGEGYYSLLDVLTDTYRQGPPKYPYPRYSIMPMPFFDIDTFGYLDDPNNTEHDYLDFLKRIHLGDDFLFTTGGEFRFRDSNETNSRLLNTAPHAGNDNTYQLTRGRVYGDFWFQDIFRVYGEFLTATSSTQTLPLLATDKDVADILNLFVELKLMTIEDAGVYARVGRQELLYGSQRLISPLDWANTQRTFQGAKGYWHSENVDIDVFSVQPLVLSPDTLTGTDHNQTFSGGWFTYHRGNDLVFDAYCLNLNNCNPGAATGRYKDVGDFCVTTFGSRFAGAESGFLWDFEGAMQVGAWANQQVAAGMGTGGLGYYFADVPMSPTFWAYYDYASGDHNPGGSNVHGTFLQLFPFNHYYFGCTDLVGRQNIHDLNFQSGIYITPWISLWGGYHVLNLDSAKDALYNSAGAPIRISPTGIAGTNVGDVLNCNLNFHLDKHSDFLISWAHLYAGDFIRETASNPSAARDSDYFWLQYSFRW
jgi:Alginate export